jgi:hypothetical protein
MAKASVIKFESNKRSIELTLTSRSFPDATTDWDRDVINAGVAVEAGVFQGKFDTFIWSHELGYLLRLLEELHQHVGQPVKAVFRCRETTLRFEFHLNSFGRLAVYVTVREQPASDVKLSFTIAADQSHLPIWVDMIRKAIETFPPQIEARPLGDPLHVE